MLVIKSDGTGTLTYISEATVSGTNNHVSPAHPYTIQDGDVLAEWELTWNIVDEKLMFDGEGKRYFTCEIDYIADSKNDQTICDFGGEGIDSYTYGRYTLEDGQLYSGSTARYTKVD